jgi:uncharacterized protein (TIGR02147 family)
MKDSVFAFDDYRAYLRKRIESEETSRGLITRMANAAQCQRSHLSRVISGTLHLTPDQALGLTRHWNFNDDETDYFLTLVDRDRAGSPALRARLGNRLQASRRKQEDLTKRLKRMEVIPTGIDSTYYSAWYWSAIHILVSIPEFQTIEAISRRLALPDLMVKNCLEALEQQGLVKNSGKNWKIGSASIHLPRNTPVIGVHHNNWRQRAVMDAVQPGSDGVHYTVVQSLSVRDFEKLKAMMLRWIDEYAAVASPSQEQELICFACDLFRV